MDNEEKRSILVEELRRIADADLKITRKNVPRRVHGWIYDIFGSYKEARLAIGIDDGRKQYGPMTYQRMFSVLYYALTNEYSRSDLRSKFPQEYRYALREYGSLDAACAECEFPPFPRKRSSEPWTAEKQREYNRKWQRIHRRKKYPPGASK